MSLFTDDHLGHAISNVRRRSERQEDIEKLRSSFVDVGILKQLQNNDNQIIYGRRGTGKTHALKMLGLLASSPGQIACYIDLRTLGSTAQFSDDSLSIRQRCTCLFRDILVYIHDALLEYLLGRQEPLSESAGALLDAFADAAVSEIRSERETTVSVKAATIADSNNKMEVSIVPSPKVTIGHQGHHANQLERTTTSQLSSEDTIIFPGINTLLALLLRSEKSTMLLLLDEWSSLPWDIQPYLAEFLKRAFFANPSVSIKIASLEQRSNFGELRSETRIGFEVGSDISAAVDLDDYYIWEKHPDAVTSVFADILFKHVKNELPYEYLEGRYSVRSSLEFAERLCAGSWVFAEIVRASEGVVRDMINIFSSSYFGALLKKEDKIYNAHVREAARKWFEQDKMPNLDIELRKLLDKINSVLIARRSLYGFCLPIELEKHRGIERLVDARIVHLIHRGTEDEDNPGVRYALFRLDYGCYVQLLETNKQPELGFRRGGDFSRTKQIKKFVISREFLESP